jgi:hypothetical protein
MSGHYDKIKADLSFRKEVANSCGVGFDVPATLTPIEPIKPNNKRVVREEVAASA